MADALVSDSTVKRMTNKKPRKKAGHRSWAAGNAKIPGGHRGDIMSTEKRRALMSRIRAKGTAPERAIMAGLDQLGLSFECHAKDLPGRPDVVFRSREVAVFIDGDFWHGWRFPLWEDKLAPAWRAKIAATRERDRKNFRRLRAMGWKVLRIWEHQVEMDPVRCLQTIVSAVDARRESLERAHAHDRA